MSLVVRSDRTAYRTATDAIAQSGRVVGIVEILCGRGMVAVKGVHLGAHATDAFDIVRRFGGEWDVHSAFWHVPEARASELRDALQAEGFKVIWRDRMITRRYRRGQPHPAEISVFSRDGGATWEGRRSGVWHGKLYTEEWYGSDRLTSEALDRIAEGYRLVREGDAV